MRYREEVRRNQRVKDEGMISKRGRKTESFGIRRGFDVSIATDVSIPSGKYFNSWVFRDG